MSIPNTLALRVGLALAALAAAQPLGGCGAYQRGAYQPGRGWGGMRRARRSVPASRQTQPPAPARQDPEPIARPDPSPPTAPPRARDRTAGSERDRAPHALLSPSNEPPEDAASLHVPLPSTTGLRAGPTLCNHARARSAIDARCAEYGLAWWLSPPPPTPVSLRSDTFDPLFHDPAVDGEAPHAAAQEPDDAPPFDASMAQLHPNSGDFTELWLRMSPVPNLTSGDGFAMLSRAEATHHFLDWHLAVSGEVSPAYGGSVGSRSVYGLGAIGWVSYEERPYSLSLGLGVTTNGGQYLGEPSVDILPGVLIGARARIGPTSGIHVRVRTGAALGADYATLGFAALGLVFPFSDSVSLTVRGEYSFAGSFDFVAGTRIWLNGAGRRGSVGLDLGLAFAVLENRVPARSRGFPQPAFMLGITGELGLKFLF